MAPRQQHSIAPLCDALASTEQQQARTSTPTKGTQQESSLTKSRASSGHPDALSYRAVAARAVGGRSTNNVAHASAHGGVLPQLRVRKRDTHSCLMPDSNQTVAVQAVAADVPPANDSQCRPPACDYSLKAAMRRAAPAACGTLSGLPVGEGFSSGASVPVAAPAAASGRLPAGKKTGQRGRGEEIERRAQNTARAFVGPAISLGHLTARSSREPDSLQTSRSPTSSSTCLQMKTQQRRSLQGPENSPLPRNFPAASDDHSRRTRLPSPEKLEKGKGTEGRWRTKRKKQHQRRHVSTDRHSQQDEVVQRQPRHHAHQLQQQARTAGTFVGQEGKQHVMGRQPQNREKVKQSQSRQHDYMLAKHSRGVASSDGATSDASEGIDDDTSCWLVKDESTPSKGGLESKRNQNGGNANPSSSNTATDREQQDACAIICGLAKAGYASNGKEKTKACQQQEEVSKNCSQINRCRATIFSCSSTCSSSTSISRTKHSSSSISSTCSVSSIGASGSNNISCNNSIPNSTSTTHFSNDSASSSNTRDVAAGTPPTIQSAQSCSKPATPARAVHPRRQASCRLGMHQGTCTKKARGRNGEGGRQQNNGPPTGQQDDRDQSVVLPPKVVCSSIRQTGRHQKGSPFSEKLATSNQSPGIRQRDTSFNQHPLRTECRSSSRCSSTMSAGGCAVKSVSLHSGMCTAAGGSIASADERITAPPANSVSRSVERACDLRSPRARSFRNSSASIRKFTVDAQYKSKQDSKGEQRDNKVDNIRGLSASRIGSVPAEKTSQTVPAESDICSSRSTLASPAAAKAASSRDTRFLVRDSADSTSRFPWSVGVSSTSNAKTAAALAVAASTSCLLASPSSAAHNDSAGHKKVSMNSGVHASLPSSSRKTSKSYGPVNIKWIAGSKEGRMTSQSRNTAGSLGPEQLLDNAALHSGAVSSSVSFDAAGKRVEETPPFVHIGHGNNQSLTTFTFPPLKVPATYMCRPAGRVSSARPNSLLNCTKTTSMSTGTSAASTLIPAASIITPEVFQASNKFVAAKALAPQIAKEDAGKKTPATGAATVVSTASASSKTKTLASHHLLDDSDSADPTDRIQVLHTTSCAHALKSPSDGSTDECGAGTRPPAQATSQCQTMLSKKIAAGGDDATKNDSSAVCTTATCSSEVLGSVATTAVTDLANANPDCLANGSIADRGEDSAAKLTEQAGVACKFTHITIEGDNSNDSEDPAVVTSVNPDRMSLVLPDGSLNLKFFKVFPCKNRNVLHEKKICPHYHNSRDRRRCDKSHNRHELLYHPHIYKQRFCSSLPCTLPFRIQNEIRASLFTEEEERNPDSEFFVNKFKTIWCPYGSQHDWRTCVYAHTYQDCRRSPLIGYGSEPCAAWNKDLHSADYEKRCPYGARCSFSHGSKEQLYHPSYYKTMPCIDYRPAAAGGIHNRGRATAQHRNGTSECALSSSAADAGGCPRGFLCAFYHESSERRLPTPPASHFVYTMPLPVSQLKLLQPLFLKPPLFNLDDFEAFGHTRGKQTVSLRDHVAVRPVLLATCCSRQTAALRRSQAVNHTQGSGGELSKQLRQAPKIPNSGGRVAAYNDLTVCPRSSAKSQYRSSGWHKLRGAPAPRFREIGTLSSPLQTKWLSNSSPPHHSAAENTATFSLPCFDDSACTCVSPESPAARAVREQCTASGVKANATKDAVAVTLAPADAHANAGAAAAAKLLCDKGPESFPVGKQKHWEKTLLPETRTFDSCRHSIDPERSSGESTTKKEETKPTTFRGKEAHAIQAETLNAQQGANSVLTSCHSSVQLAPEHSVYSDRDDGAEEEHWYQCEKQHQQHIRPSQYELRAHWSLQRQQPPQQALKQPETKKEAKAQNIDIAAQTEHATCRREQNKYLESSASAEMMVPASVRIVNARQRVCGTAEDQSIGVGETSDATQQKVEPPTASATEVWISAAARCSTSACNEPITASPRKFGGGPVISGTGSLSEGIEAAASLGRTGLHPEARGQTAMARSVAALPMGHATLSYGRCQAAGPQKGTPGKLRTLKQQAPPLCSPLSEASGLSQHFVALEEALEEYWGRLSYPTSPPTVTSLQDDDRAELHNSSPHLQSQGQHEQGLLQRQDFLLAAVPGNSQPGTLSDLLESSPVKSIPVRTNDLRNLANAIGCTHESMRAAVVAPFDQRSTDRSAGSTLAFAARRDGPQLEGLSQDLLAQTAPGRGAAHGQETDATGVNELSDVHRSSCSATCAADAVEEHLNRAVECFRVTENDAISPSVLSKAVEIRTPRWSWAPPGLPMHHHMQNLKQKQRAATPDSPTTKEKIPLKVTSSATEETAGLVRHRPPLLGELTSSESHSRVEDDVKSGDGLVDHGTSNGTNGTTTDSRNCTHKSSANGNNHIKDSPYESGRTEGKEHFSTHSLRSGEGSASTSSSSNSSTAGPVSGRRFVGLFNNGWVWQGPFSTYTAGADSMFLRAAAASDNKALRFNSSPPWKDDAPRTSLRASSTLARTRYNAGSEVLVTEANGILSSRVTSVTRDMHCFPASSPAIPGHDQTPWTALAGSVECHISPANSPTYHHVSHLRTFPQWHWQSDPQVSSKSGATGEVQTTGALAGPMKASKGSFETLQPMPCVGPTLTADVSEVAGESELFAAHSRVAAACGAAHVCRTRECSLRKVASVSLERSRCNSASDSPLDLLRRPLQSSSRVHQTRTSCVHQAALFSDRANNLSPAALWTPRYNMEEDIRRLPYDTATAGTVGGIGAAAQARTSVTSSSTTRAVTKKAGALTSMGSTLSFTQCSDRLVNTAVSADEHGTRQPSATTLVADSGVRAGSVIDLKEGPHKTGSSSHATSSNVRNSGKHFAIYECAAAAYTNWKNKCEASTASYEPSIPGKDSSGPRVQKSDHYMHNFMQSLPAGGSGLREDAVYDAGEPATGKELTEESGPRAAFAFSAPPKLYDTRYNVRQPQDSRQGTNSSTDLLQQPQQRDWRKYKLLPQLSHLRQHDWKGMQLYDNETQASDKAETLQHQRKLLHVLPSLMSELRDTRDKVPPPFQKDQTCQDESDFTDRQCYCGFEHDMPATTWPKFHYEPCCSAQEARGARSIRSLSDQGAAAAAAAVLNLLDDDERPGKLWQHEEQTMSPWESAVRTRDILTAPPASARGPTYATITSPAPTDRRKATSGVFIVSPADSVSEPAETQTPVNTPGKAALPLSWGRTPLKGSAKDICCSLGDCLPHSGTGVDFIPLTSSFALQHQLSKDDDNPIYLSDGTRAETAVKSATLPTTEARTTAEDGREIGGRISTALSWTATTLSDHSPSSDSVRNRASALHKASTSAKTAVGGPLMIGTGTVLDQQQLLLNLLHSRLWEKLLVFVHPTAADSSDATCPELSQQTVHCRRRVCSAGVTKESRSRVEETRDESISAAEAPEFEPANLAGEASGATGAGGKAYMAAVPLRKGSATAGDQNHGRHSRQNRAGRNSAGVVRGYGAVEDSIAAINEETALLAETAAKAHYSCRPGFMDRDGGFQRVGRSTQVALEAAGIRLYSKGEHPRDTSVLPPTAEQFLKHQLIVLTPTSQRLSRQQHMNKIETERRCQGKLQQDDGHRKEKQTLQTYTRKEGLQQESVSTLSTDIARPEHPVVPVILLHRTPSELKKWLFRLQGPQRVNKQTALDDPHCSNGANGNCHTIGSAAVGRLHAGDAMLFKLEDNLQRFSRNDTEEVLACQQRMDASPRGALAEARVRSQSIVNFSVRATPAEDAVPQPTEVEVKQQAPPNAVTTTAALIHVFVLHIVCSCHSSLELLSHLNSEQQERCFFPRPHELPLWSAYLHSSWQSLPQRSPLRRDCNVSCSLTEDGCGSRVCRSTGGSGSGSDIAMSRRLLLASFLLSSTTSTDLTFNSFSVQSETFAAQTANYKTEVSAPSSKSAAAFHGETSRSAELRRESSRPPSKRVAHTPTNTQIYSRCESNNTMVQALRTRAAATQHFTMGLSLEKFSTASGPRGSTSAPCLTVLPGPLSMPQTITTKLPLCSDRVMLPTPGAAPGVFADPRESCTLPRPDVGNWGIFVSTDAISSFANNDASAESRLVPFLSDVSKSHPRSRTSDTSDKGHSTGRTPISERRGDIALVDHQGHLQQHHSDSDKVSSLSGIEDTSFQAGMAACSTDWARKWRHLLWGSAKKTKMLLTLMLLEELRQAKAAAAALLESTQANEVLLCLCYCRSGDHHSLRQNTSRNSVMLDLD